MKKIKNVIKFLFTAGMILMTASETLRKYDEIIGTSENDEELSQGISKEKKND